jgi:hypothetical protein
LPCHDHRSDRAVMAAAPVTVACRYVLDLALARRLPGPSVLAQLRTRRGAQRHQARFDQVVPHARADGLSRDRLRRKDATPVRANIAVPSTRRVVAQTRQRWVAAAHPDAPAAVGRQATADRPETARLVARVPPRRAIVTWAAAGPPALGPRPVSPDTGRTRVAAAVALAHRGLAARDAPDQGAQGPRGVDPDARCGKPGASGDGSRLAISLDADRAWRTALNRLPGNGDAARDAPTRREAEARAQGQAVAAVAIDGMGWNCGPCVRPRAWA